ncbi:MAG: glycosyltransferase family 4 protein [Cyclobacteriaceae bacterium]
MRIFYMIAWNFETESGVEKKILEQIRQWKTHDIEVYCSVFSNLNSNPRPAVFCNNWHFVKSNGTSFWTCVYVLDDLLYKLDPDLIYVRGQSYKFGMRELFNKYKVVYEVNSNENLELKLWSTKSFVGYFKYLWHLLTHKSLCQKVDAFITVTKELENEYAKSYPEAKCETVPNSTRIFQRESSVAVKKPRLLFVGSLEQPWQGLDHLLEMASLTPQFDYIIVGNNSVNQSLPNVQFTGLLTGEEYKRILRSCNIGIGTLALYRKGIGEACPLKVREYLAYGLPIIIGYEDTAFLDEKPKWLLQIPNTPSGVIKNINSIISFCEEMKSIRIDSVEVTPFISSEVIEKKRVQLFSLIKETESGNT